MDGRSLWKYWVWGMVVLGTVGCRHQRADPLAEMPPTPAVWPQQSDHHTGLRSLWGGNSAPAAIPVEVAPADSNKPVAADTLVAIADVRLEAAFDPKTAAGSRDTLLDLARKGYQKALEQEPKSKAALRGMARYYVRVDERDKAIEMYKRCLTHHPRDADLGHEIAMVHARWKDYPGAIAWCHYTLKNIDPENRTVKKTLGFCYAMAGQWDEALATLCAIMPEAQARHNLAGLLDHLGYPEASKAQLQLALQANPHFEPARQFLAELEKGSAAQPIVTVGGISSEP
ncbi:MAG: tetratricopeptide repeat protein [Gemmataceae bacterium]|nr:tetratricopeptide repeat protein [Gemmata sp.]MDW8198129.1 tetratricopeptide repeat protein [Gemmataceae bacterium]